MTQKWKRVIWEIVEWPSPEGLAILMKGGSTMLLGCLSRSTMAATVACLMLRVGFGATVYNEAVSGDFSNSGLTPTVIQVSAGSNRILGATGRSSTGIDRDYFTFVIPIDRQLTSVTELAGTSVGGSASFIGVQSGSQLTLPTDAASAIGLLGWTLYSPVNVDTDILSQMSVASNGSTGFVRPLGPGSYTFWIQEFSAGSFPYGFDLVLTPTPEPSTYWAIGIAFGVLILSNICVRSHRDVAARKLEG